MPGTGLMPAPSPRPAQDPGNRPDRPGDDHSEQGRLSGTVRDLPAIDRAPNRGNGGEKGARLWRRCGGSTAGGIRSDRCRFEPGAVAQPFAWASVLWRHRCRAATPTSTRFTSTSAGQEVAGTQVSDRSTPAPLARCERETLRRSGCFRFSSSQAVCCFHAPAERSSKIWRRVATRHQDSESIGTKRTEPSSRTDHSSGAESARLYLYVMQRPTRTPGRRGEISRISHDAPTGTIARCHRSDHWSPCSPFPGKAI